MDSKSSSVSLENNSDLSRDKLLSFQKIFVTKIILMVLMAKMLDCSLKVCKFKFQSHHYIHFWRNTFRKGVNLLISPAMD